MKRIFTILLSLLLASFLTACGGQTGLQDGYYTAQAAEFNFGWKEYVTILVKGGNIIWTASWLPETATSASSKWMTVWQSFGQHIETMFAVSRSPVVVLDTRT